MSKLLTAVLLLSALPLFAQVRLDSKTKTISITASEKVSADAEIADLEVGHIAYGRTKDEAFLASKKAANAILSAIKGLNIKDDAVETSDLKLNEVEADEHWTPAERAERKFKAEQSWKIHVAAPAAQCVMDIAIQAGANTTSKPEWSVLDPAALQAKAGAAALTKARKIAEQMATGLGVRLGAVLFASNEAPSLKFLPRAGLTMYENVGGGGGGEAPGKQLATPGLKIFPEKVTIEATVYAEFAIE